VIEANVDWDSTHGAVIICDMWDLRGRHHCKSAVSRLEELAPALNQVVATLRKAGALIIHAPSECMEFYRDTPERRRAADAPHHPAPAEFGWNWPNTDLEPLVPDLIRPWGPWVDEPTRCSCEPSLPSCALQTAIAPSRQVESIEIHSADAITDVGQEVFNLLEERGVQHVLVTGVHTNICVLCRDFGIRQLHYLGKRPILCRDLTDSFHRHPAGHFVGNRIVADHIETNWCPTVTSDQLIGGSPFRFAADAGHG